ncbi:hypothetical protein RSOLAG1IB_05690 [Rhizoctonia solani AG-1 IB]|uniref:Uncharacterized protein n=1 Tax=Thanatephorus cucumeris (strain AG1-IB / isolate 7/3/14) TaxID=1108050 RepID=A0A0B7G1S8_THACB|nr:hypothetical protein RSOLAG1IB_05690 [Rhizoctonia solani AG-1 IB]
MGYHHYSFAFTGNSQGNGNSKLFWFVLGGIAATAWFKIKERRQISGYKRRRALASSGESSLTEGAELRERLCDVDIGTSEAAMHVADATLDAAMRIVGTLKQTLQDQRTRAVRPSNRTIPEEPSAPSC